MARLFKAGTQQSMEALVVVVFLVVVVAVIHLVVLVALGLQGEPLLLPIKALEQHRL